MFHRLTSSIRVRLTISSIVVVGLVLSIAGVGLVEAQRRTLIDAAAARVLNQAQSIGLALSFGTSITKAETLGTSLQFVDQNGKIIGASPQLQGQPKVSLVQPGLTKYRAVEVNPAFPDAKDIASIGASNVLTNQGAVTVYDIAHLNQIQQTQAVTIRELLFILPTILIIIGLLTWLFTGLALRPVDQMRRRVDSIEEELNARIELPPGDDEIARLARTLNDLLERLDSSRIRQRSFVSDASHELRSPIASLLATVQVARAHPQSIDWTQIYDVVTAEGNRLSRLVDDLLLLASGDERGSVSKHDPIDLDELLLREVNRVRLLGEVAVDATNISAARIEGDQVLVEGAIRNLVDNACRYAQEEITVGVEMEGDVAIVTIADDGPGLGSDDPDVLFERFARLDRSRQRRSGGAGLGLAIVATTAKAHGGSVRFLTVEKGACVELRFSVHRPELSETASR